MCMQPLMALRIKCVWHSNKYRFLALLHLREFSNVLKEVLFKTLKCLNVGRISLQFNLFLKKWSLRNTFWKAGIMFITNFISCFWTIYVRIGHSSSRVNKKFLTCVFFNDLIYGFSFWMLKHLQIDNGHLSKLSGTLQHYNKLFNNFIKWPLFRLIFAVKVTWNQSSTSEVYWNI